MNIPNLALRHQARRSDFVAVLVVIASCSLQVRFNTLQPRGCRKRRREPGGAGLQHQLTWTVAAQQATGDAVLQPRHAAEQPATSETAELDWLRRRDLCPPGRPPGLRRRRASRLVGEAPPRRGNGDATQRAARVPGAPSAPPPVRRHSPPPTAPWPAARRRT